MAEKTRCAHPGCTEIVADGGELCVECDPNFLATMLQRSERKTPVFCDAHFEEHMRNHGIKIKKQPKKSRERQPVRT